MAGISSNVHRFLGGHWLHALVAAGIYASMIAISVPMEVAYEYDRYSALVWTASPLALAWFIAATIGALTADWIVTRSGRTFGLAAAMGVFVVTAALQFIMVRPYLPAYSVTQASFQTWTAQAAYLKGVGYSAAFAAFFVLVPFHFVITMQRELHKGRHLIAFEFLTGGKFGIAPLGALYLRVWLLGGALYSIGSTSHLLEALKATQYSNLFILSIQIRWLLFLALGMEGIMWYHSALNELKRECTVVYRLANPVQAHRTDGSMDVV